MQPQSQAAPAAAYTLVGVVATRMGNAHSSTAPYELLQAGDEQIVIAVGNDRQFASLAEAIGDPHLAQQKELTTNTDRVANCLTLRAPIERRLASGVSRTGSPTY